MVWGHLVDGESLIAAFGWAERRISAAASAWAVVVGPEGAVHMTLQRMGWDGFVANTVAYGYWRGAGSVRDTTRAPQEQEEEFGQAAELQRKLAVATDDPRPERSRGRLQRGGLLTLAPRDTALFASYPGL